MSKVLAKFIIIIILTTTLVLAKSTPEPKEIPSVDDIIPTTINNWTGENVKIEESIYKMLDRGEFFVRRYKFSNDEKKTISVAVVLSSKRNHIHDPGVCYRGQGISMDKFIDVSLNDGNIAQLVQGKQRNNDINLLYWYTDLNTTFNKRINFMKKVTIDKLLNRSSNMFALIVIIAPEATVSQDEIIDIGTSVNKALFSIK